MSRFVCERLSPQHDRRAFRCGVRELDEYLQQRAGQDGRRRVAAVFVLTPDDEPQRVAGFYTLSSASVVLSKLPDDLAKKLPRYPAIPAVLIGRLAHDENFRGVGKLLLLDALARSAHHSNDVAAAVMLVDTKDRAACQFYAKFGFVEFARTSGKMFLPMATVRKLLKVNGQ